MSSVSGPLTLSIVNPPKAPKPPTISDRFTDFCESCATSIGDAVLLSSYTATAICERNWEQLPSTEKVETTHKVFMRDCEEMTRELQAFADRLD